MSTPRPTVERFSLYPSRDKRDPSHKTIILLMKTTTGRRIRLAAEIDSSEFSEWSIKWHDGKRPRMSDPTVDHATLPADIRDAWFEGISWVQPFASWKQFNRMQLDLGKRDEMYFLWAVLKRRVSTWRERLS